MEWFGAIIDYGVIGVLIIMSVLAVSVAIERKCFYRRVELAAFNDKKELELE